VLWRCTEHQADPCKPGDWLLECSVYVCGSLRFHLSICSAALDLHIWITYQLTFSLVKVSLENLELRRIHADLVFAYKIIFGLTDVNNEDIFKVCASNSWCGHGYKLYMPYSKSTARYNYFNHRVGRIWNALPYGEVDFSSLRHFRNSLTAKVLVRYCSLNFI